MLNRSAFGDGGVVGLNDVAAQIRLVRPMLALAGVAASVGASHRWKSAP